MARSSPEIRKILKKIYVSKLRYIFTYFTVKNPTYYRVTLATVTHYSRYSPIISYVCNTYIHTYITIYNQPIKLWCYCNYNVYNIVLHCITLYAILYYIALHCIHCITLH